MTAKLLEVKPQPQQLRQQFLQFSPVVGYRAMCPLVQIVEAISISRQQVVPIPELPAHILGVHHWRGRVLWIFDLAAILGIEVPSSNSIYLSKMPIAIVQSIKDGVEANIGLAIAQIDDTLWASSSDILRPSGEIDRANSGNSPYILGYFTASDRGLVASLNIEAIFQAIPSG
jgi:positive phototaxis protein PixI